ncbi:MAG: hypothetical protein WCJ74_01420 [bacterium]
MINKYTQRYLVISAVIFILLGLFANSSEWNLLAAFILIPSWALVTFEYLINISKKREGLSVNKQRRNYFAKGFVIFYIILFVLDLMGNEFARKINIVFVENLIVYPVLCMCIIIVIRDFFRWIYFRER